MCNICDNLATETLKTALDRRFKAVWFFMPRNQGSRGAVHMNQKHINAADCDALGNGNFSSETSTIFLAMVWGGGGPYSLSQLMHAYDRINRGIPSREEIEIALNELLSTNLVSRRLRKFTVRKEAGEAFEAFRKKRRSRKFEAAEAFLARMNPSHTVRRLVRIDEGDYQAALRKYREFMYS